MHWLSSRWKIFWTISCALGVCGFGLRYLAVHDFDLSSSSEWLTEANMLYGPWVHHPAGVAKAVCSLPYADFGASLWKLLCLAGNGQWDPRLLALTTVGLLLLAFGIWGAAMIGEISGAVFFVAALGGGALLIWPGILPQMLAASQLWTALLLVFSLAHLAGTAHCRRFSTGWWGAQAMGLLNVLTSAAGIASPLAVSIWAVVSSKHQQTKVPIGLVIWNALLIAMGIIRLVTTANGNQTWIDPAVFHHLFAWPFSGFALALIASGPSVFLLSRLDDRNNSSPAPPGIQLFCWWILIQILFVGSGYFRPTSTWPMALFVFGLLIHFCALATILASKQRPLIKVFVGTVWMIGLFNTLIQQSQRSPSIDVEPASATEDVTPSTLGDPLLRGISPLPIRTPLALKPALALTKGFAPEAAPPLEGKPKGVPTWGSWKAEGSTPDARFISEPMNSSSPLLRIYLAGSLRPPETSLVLRTTEGREIPPLQERAETGKRWKELNFVNPGSGFRMVAQVARPDLWLAFSAPLEVGHLTWISGKLIAEWPWLIGFGLVLGSCGCTGALRAWRRDRDSPEPRFVSGGMIWIPWLALFAYILFLANFVDSYAAGSDAAGYLNSAKLLLQGRFTFPPRIIPGLTISPEFYTPLGLNLIRGAIVPGYPPGLPLMLAGIGRLWSLDSAIPAIVLAHLMLGVFFTERLAGICGLTRPWSYLAAGMIAACPLYVFMGLQPMSDVPSLVWVTAALYFALSSREKASMAIWAGLATALAVLLRPANAICFLPILFAIGTSPKRLATFALGGLPGALFSAWYNFHLYGSPFQTAYGDVSLLFSPIWLGQTFQNYAYWITVYFTPIIWLAFLGTRGRTLTRQAQVSVAAVVIVYLGFYAFYRFTHETWWYLRFVLPAFPCLAVLSAAGVKKLVDLKHNRSMDRSSAVLAAIGALLLGNVIWRFSELPVLDQGRGDQVYRRSAKWIENHTPANAVVLCFQTSGAVAFYTEHPILRSEVGDTAQLAPIVGELIRLNIPVYALVFRFDTMPPLERLPGRWEKNAEIGFATIWKVIPSR